MSFYDHKVMQDLRLGRWASQPGLRNWQQEREIAQQHAPAGSAKKRTGRFSRLRVYFSALSAAGKPAAR